MESAGSKYEVEVGAAVPGLAQKKISVLLPVIATAALVCGKQTWNLQPLFIPETAWRVVMGIVAGMYIIGFWFVTARLRTAASSLMLQART
jgi:hypothetical protein